MEPFDTAILKYYLPSFSKFQDAKLVKKKKKNETRFFCMSFVLTCHHRRCTPRWRALLQVGGGVRALIQGEPVDLPAKPCELDQLGGAEVIREGAAGNTQSSSNFPVASLGCTA